jgi:hypothetical protein
MLRELDLAEVNGVIASFDDQIDLCSGFRVPAAPCGDGDEDACDAKAIADMLDMMETDKLKGVTPPSIELRGVTYLRPEVDIGGSAVVNEREIEKVLE